jgi:hypothetical protein
MHLASATRQWLPGDLLETVHRGGSRFVDTHASERFLFLDVEGDAERLLNGLLASSTPPGHASSGPPHGEDTATAVLTAMMESAEHCQDDAQAEREARYLLEWAGSRAAFVVPIDSMQELVFSGRVAVGRSLDTNLVLRDPSVSRLHAWIERSTDGALWLHDTGSKNGCWVNGERIKGRVELVPGDHVRFGRISALVCTAAALSTALHIDRG